MTNAIHLSGTPSRPAAAPEVAGSATGVTPGRGPALRGELIAESEADIRVRVGEGTWTFDRRDVLRVTRTDTATDSDTRPVLVDIRPGSYADFTRRMRVDLVERPLTLGAAPSEAVGDDQLQQLTRRWATRLRIAERDNPHGATFTFAHTRSLNGSDDGVNCDSLD